MNSISIIALPLIACATSAVLVFALMPLLQRYAMARPNARSSHTIPTPQGGGIAVIAATIAVMLLSGAMLGIAIDRSMLAVFAATIFIACVGAVDDLRPIPVLPRLLLQTIAVATVVASLPADFHLISFIPIWIERAFLLLAGLWFVNLVNFMDGIDWITVAEIVPISSALALFGFCGYMQAGPALVALTLAGAMIGFAPFNKPVAKIFLGDVGSLPIGLLTGWCLLQLANEDHLVAAILLPLYYLADATITLIRRFANGEVVWVAHRSHFYQRAGDNNFPILQTVAEIFVLNLGLAALAATSILVPSLYVSAACLTAGAGGVAVVLIRFSRPRNALR